jgi:hypothetical protein
MKRLLNLIFVLALAMPSVALASWRVGQDSTYRGPSFSLPQTSFEMGKTGDQVSLFFGLMNLESWSADYFDAEGTRSRRLTAIRSEARGGLNLLQNGILSLSTGLRATKVDSKVYYAKPDFILNLDVVRSDFLDLKFYSQVLFPLKASLLDPTTFAEGGALELDMAKAVDKTIITGIVPTAKAGLWGVGFYLSGDARAIKYAKSHNYPAREDVPNLDDTVYRYAQKWIVGTEFSIGIFSLETSAAYDTRYIPRHLYNTRSDRWEYRYHWERVSYTRAKTSFALTSSASLACELIHIRNGFFDVERTGDEMRSRTTIGLNMSL